ncbi:MAG: AAA family ATPase [Candidatus Nomurabacteria bacterium]|nr:AAA family ATPase [Candidatus Nomurabacteria bacterium]
MKIILFRGLPGSGKTTMSDFVSKETGVPILRKDDIYDLLSDFIEDHKIKNEISYGSLYSILETNKQTNSVFIVDYPFNKIEHFSIIKDWCKENNVELKSILVTCSDEVVWAERFNTRAESPKPNQLLTNFEELKKHYDTMQIKPENGELSIDTLNSEESLLNMIKSFI